MKMTEPYILLVFTIYTCNELVYDIHVRITWHQKRTTRFVVANDPPVKVSH